MAFTSSLKDTATIFFDEQGLYLYEPETDEVIQIARAGNKAPGTVENFSSFSAGNIGGASGLLSLNDAGQIAMHATTTGDVSFPTMAGAGPYLFSKDEIINIAMVGAPDPRGLGAYQTFAFIGLANSGQMAWTSRIEIGQNDIPSGFFMTDPTDNSVNTVFLQGDTVSVGSFVDLNNMGNAVLIGDDSDGDDEEQLNQDIWTANKDTFNRLVNDDELVPGGGAVFDRMTFADINDNNEIVFLGRLRESADGPTINSGMFFVEDEGVHTIGIHGVDSVVGDPLEVYLTPRINNLGQMAFQARLNNFGGIYLVTKTGGKLLLKTGDPIPGGTGTFRVGTSSTVAEMWLNDAGQVLFFGGGGYWVVDADGNLNPVVLIGQELEGSTVTDVEMVGVGQLDASNVGGFSNRRPMNNSGQVVFQAELADGRDGIFLWTAPPPPPPDPEIDSILVDGNGIVVNLDTGLGATYQLRRRDTLNAGDWQNEGAAADGTGNSIDLRHPNALPTDKQFYDVLITLPDS